MPDLPYWAQAQVYGKQYGVDPRLAEAVMEQESGGNPHARSGVGAEGLMQLMPGTAAGLGVKNPWDPNQNLRGGIKYLAELLHTFHGNMSEAIAGYNAGPGAVEKYHGTPPYAETQDYVRKVEANYEDIGGKAPKPGSWDESIQHEDAQLDKDIPIMHTMGKHGEVTTSFLQSLHTAAASANPWQSMYELLTKGGVTAESK